MNGKKVPFTILILAIWAGMIIIAVALCFVTSTDDVSPYYDEMTEAANIADRAMEEIRNTKPNAEWKFTITINSAPA